MSKKRFEVSPEVLEEARKILAMYQDSFGAKLKTKRQAMGCSLREFSMFCGIAPGRLSEYENLKRFPTFKNFQNILKGFRMIGLSKESMRELQMSYQNNKLHVSAKTFGRLNK